MWIVALALRRPYTFVVMALVIIILFFVTIFRTPVDIFPDIDIPVVSVVWFYTGLSPQDMADRIVANSERGITTTVNDIEHMESQSVYGYGVIKVFFRPGTNVQGAIAQITAIAQTTVRAGEIADLRNPISGKIFRARAESGSRAVVVVGRGPAL